jgi:hypothetical protein
MPVFQQDHPEWQDWPASPDNQEQATAASSNQPSSDSHCASSVAQSSLPYCPDEAAKAFSEHYLAAERIAGDRKSRNVDAGDVQRSPQNKERAIQGQTTVNFPSSEQPSGGYGSNQSPPLGSAPTRQEIPMQDAVVGRMPEPQPPMVHMPAPTPIELLAHAYASGATPDVLAQLQAVQERYEDREARKAFNRAMGKAQAEFPVIAKDNQVSYGQGKTSYWHEDLAGIVSTVRPILAKYGLRFRWQTVVEGDLVRVTCLVIHDDGHEEPSTLSGPRDTSGSKNAHQSIGSGVTYLERYTLKAALGLAAAKDDDAQAAGAQTDPGKITAEQVQQIQDRITKAGLNQANVLQWLNGHGIPAIDQIPPAQLPKVLAKIESAERAIKAKKAEKTEAHEQVNG